MGLAPRQWFIMLAFYASYLIFGAAIFYQIEHKLETERRAQALQNRIDINELLVEYTSPDDLEIQNAILDKISNYCGKPVTNYTLDEYEKPYQWTFYHAVFFAFTVCSTLGYGNIAPTTTFGRYFMILYALIGMPVNGILYTYLGEYFGSRFIAAYKRYKAYKMANNKNYVPRRLSMIGQITITLIPAAIILIFLPSCLFTYFEGWPYSVSVYYSFVTLSTIGFGDFIPTFQPHQEREFGIYFRFYQIFVLIWFVFGLSYILMLIGFIARGMRSKRIARLEQQLSDNIKLTHNRIWNGVTKDVGYLRRILNEIYLMKFRPVYSMSGEILRLSDRERSYSCPDLIMYSTNPQYFPRKRAFSEDNYLLKEERGYISKQHCLSRHSETNLMHINRERTFEQQNILDNTAELLAKVVSALNEFNDFSEPVDEGGYNLFSDNEILRSEDIKSPARILTKSKTVGSIPLNQRQRAASEFTGIRSLSSGSEQRKLSEKGFKFDEFIAQQAIEQENKPNNGVTITIDGSDENNDTMSQIRRPSIFQKLFKRRNTVHQDMTSSPLAKIKHKIIYNTPVIERKNSCIFNEPIKKYPNMDEIRRSSTFSMASSADKTENILENTTIADLIRAIENAHTKEHASSLRRQSTFLKPRNSIKEQSSLQPPALLGVDLKPRRLSLHPMHHNYLRQNSAPNQSVIDADQSNTQNIFNSDLQQPYNGSRRFSAFPGNSQRNTEYFRSKSDQTTPNYVRRKSLLPMSPLATNNAQPQPKIIVRKKTKRRNSQDVLGQKKNSRDLL